MPTNKKKKKKSTKSRPTARRVSTAPAPSIVDDYQRIDFHSFAHNVARRLWSNTKQGTQPLLTTDVTGLYEAYLKTFPDAASKQHHTCRCCQKFIETYGGLVTIDENGTIKSALWNPDDAPLGYYLALGEMKKQVERARVTGVFLSGDRVWGHEESGGWHHFFANNPSVYIGAALDAHQAMAAKKMDFQTVYRALEEFPLALVDTALKVLDSDALYRSEKVIGPAKFLVELHEARNRTDHKRKSNVVWRAIATAPAGFCHPRSSMIGTLLEDIAAGMPFDVVSRRFAQKMRPDVYQRPTEAPKAGTIAQAEKLFEQMGLARALRRRFARLEDLEVLWSPEEVRQAVKGGVFGHLKARQPKQAIHRMEVPAQPMTWVKFERDVLPHAEQIEILAPASGNYTALVTAADPSAPPILQWDRPERRNPVSWYVYMGGSTAVQFGLLAAYYHPVNAITLNPSRWYGNKADHHADSVIFIIDGAKESRNPGLVLFPECLRSELHGVRSVIEAHSRSMRLDGAAEQSAAGLMLSKGNSVRVRVTTKNVTSIYNLDRID